MTRYIRAKELEKQFGIDRVTAWRWGRDKTKAFPKPVRLALNVSVYDVEEVEAWFAERKRANSL
jgi:predicted DNA-binding transcriptional regulator AlpA